MEIADMDPSNSNNWKNFNKFRMGEMSAQEVIDGRVQNGSGRGRDQNSGSGQGSGSGSGTGQGGPENVGGGIEGAVEDGFGSGGFGGIGGPDQSGDSGGSGGGSGSDVGKAAPVSGDGSGTGGGSGPAGPILDSPVEENSDNADEGLPGGSPADEANESDDVGFTSGNPESDSTQSDDSSMAIVDQRPDGSVKIHYYDRDENAPLGWAYSDTETYKPNGDGTYSGNKGGHLDSKPADKERYPVQNQTEGDTIGKFRFKTQEQEDKEKENASGNQQNDSNNEDEDSSDDSNSENEEADAGDQGYTPNHDNGIPAAAAENVSWAKARQEWINGGLVNPGQSPKGNRPNTEEINQNPSSNPRQGWAINPGPGGSHQVQPTTQDWAKKFGELGLKDPPKPSFGNDVGQVPTDTNSAVNGTVGGAPTTSGR